MKFFKQEATVNQQQLQLLTKLATGKIKAYQAISGIASDQKPEELTDEFNDVLKLVELGMVVDVSEWPQFAPAVAQERDSTGRDVVIVKLTKLADLMFQRTPWQKRIN